MESIVYAMGTGGSAGGQGSGMGAIVPLLIMFAIFYFLLIRPQQKKAKEHRAMLSALKKGDRVVSSGGLHGVVTGLADDVVTVEIAPKVRVKISRSAIGGVIRKTES
ncbi:MAG: preprotein translocase subunit YajC [Deltaproteobacteria bacterium]|nr:preprotein translocase subunit YajC [Deltaproteobacteria bacterium]MBW2015853.1 preprotein translocase subunit YajC [Deltaproteobacteria bacterium]MBW2128988.1 preprotein translocase subunit YajC [Deltaproteobacteria bacterium]MBW2302917.1 preprotein translocase subunit YajC [Deltaproteobacteria bacterium]